MTEHTYFNKGERDAARNSRLTEQLIGLWNSDIILAGHVPLRRLCVSFTA